ncbi:MAG: hypothetical protein AAF806_18355 [Bacteroidota bacterium]
MKNISWLKVLVYLGLLIFAVVCWEFVFHGLLWVFGVIESAIKASYEAEQS